MGEESSLSARVKQRVRRLYDEGQFTQRQLATKLGYSYSAVHPYVSGDRDIPLEVLEAICAITNTPEAEMVVPNAHEIKQLSPFETALLRFVRAWPQSVRESLWGFLVYFADEPPVEAQSRSMFELWRHATPAQRDNIFALSQMLREGALGVDIREGLIRQLLAGGGDAAPSETATQRIERRRGGKQP